MPYHPTLMIDIVIVANMSPSSPQGSHEQQGTSQQGVPTVRQGEGEGAADDGKEMDIARFITLDS